MSDIHIFLALLWLLFATLTVSAVEMSRKTKKDNSAWLDSFGIVHLSTPESLQQSPTTSVSMVVSPAADFEIFEKQKKEASQVGNREHEVVRKGSSVGVRDMQSLDEIMTNTRQGQLLLKVHRHNSTLESEIGRPVAQLVGRASVEMTGGVIRADSSQSFAQQSLIKQQSGDITQAGSSQLAGGFAANLLDNSARDSVSRHTCTPETMKATRDLIASRHKFLLDEEVCETSALLNSTSEDYRLELEDIDEFAPSLEYISGSHDLSNRCSKLPKLFLLGMPHAGSTTLANLLNQHPNMSFGAKKEHLYWTGTGGHIAHNGSRFSFGQCSNLECYRNEFRVNCESVQLTFDASPATIWLGNPKLPPGGFHRMSPGIPAIRMLQNHLGNDVKFVVVIRDPVDWEFSIHTEWQTGVNSRVKHALDEMLCLADSLESWLKVFSPSNFLFIKAEDMFTNMSGTVGDILDFVGVDRIAAKEDYVAGRRRATKHATYQERVSFHADANHRNCKSRLENLTGLRFFWQGSQ